MSKLTTNVEAQIKIKLWKQFCAKTRFLIPLYVYYLHGVTHNHLPALLAKGCEEMAMDNSIVNRSKTLPMHVIVAKS